MQRLAQAADGRYHARPRNAGTALRRSGRVAQLVEQGIENPRVGGSIPSPATMKFKGLHKCWPFLFLALHRFCTCLHRGETSGVLSQVLGGQVRVAKHRLVWPPSAKLHERSQRGAGHHVPAGPGVPQVVPAQRRNPGPLLRPPEPAVVPAHVGHSIFVREHPARVLAQLALQHSQGLVVERRSNRPLIKSPVIQAGRDRED